MALPVTAFFGGILALWMLFLASRVIRFRRATRTSLGDGGDAMGERLIRGHGNAVEAVPIFLILLGLSEGMGSANWFLIVVGTVFSAGRALHGIHFLAVRNTGALRVWGMILTASATAVAALDLIRQSLF